MSTILGSYESITIDEFRGEDSLRDSSDVTQPWGLVSENVEYFPGGIQTRRGFYGALSGISGTPKHTLSRVTTGNVARHYFKDGPLFTYALDNGAGSTVGLPTTTDGACNGNMMAGFGNRVFMSGVVNAAFDDNSTTAAVLMPPPKYPSELLLSVTAAAGGFCTPGQHYFALILETANGFKTLPSPFFRVGAAHNQVGMGAVVVAGNQTLTLTWTLASGAWGPFTKANLVMTTVANPYRYLYTGLQVALSGSANAVFSGISLPDGILAQQEDDSFQEQVLVQDSSISTSNPAKFPLDCSGVFASQQRMWYFAGGGVYISEPGLPETVTLTQNFRKLPKGETPLNAFSLQGTVYLSGPQFTYAETDTGGPPVTWPVTRIVDDSIGMCHPNAVAENESGYAFVGHYNGLYVFDGSAYSRRPMSYYQTGLWKQIQWPTAATPWPLFSIVDLPGERMVAVLAVVAGVNTIMVWDYTDGMAAEQVKFSKWSLPTTAIGLSSNAPILMLRAMNFGDAIATLVGPQLWILTNAAALMWKRKPLGASAPYTDERSGASCGPGGRYKTSYLGMGPGSGVNGYHGVRLRVSGAGTLTPRAYALDDIQVKTMQGIPLNAAPGRAFDRLFELRSEGCAVDLSGSVAAGDYFKVAQVALAADQFARRRPGVALP